MLESLYHVASGLAEINKNIAKQKSENVTTQFINPIFFLFEKVISTTHDGEILGQKFPGDARSILKVLRFGK